MQQLARDRALAGKLGAAARATIEEKFSPATIGARYRQRLEAIAGWSPAPKLAYSQLTEPMTQLEGMALLAGLCGGMVLSGYWLAAMLLEATPSERLAVSLLAGLGTVLLLVSIVNFFVPLSLPWAGLCLVPLAVTLAWSRSRRALAADLLAFGRDHETILVGGLVAVFFALLLWPILTDPHRVFYDGSPNHDSFFWIASAEYLKRHTYMDPGTISATQPLFNATGAIVGWKPAWGRMGAEGLLALTSTLSGTSSIKIYLYGTAALFLPWVAAIYLVAKTFFSNKLSPPALVALALLQPVFIFYHANANLPNLIGTLTGAGAVLATEHVLRTSPKPAGPFWGWWTLLLLSLHGLYCAYPEMIPFTGLSCALLWLRAWFRRPTPGTRKSALLALVAVLFSALVNPATTIRAINGFIAVLGIAQSNQNHINIFAHLSLSEYLPALSTLSIPVASRLGDWLGVPLSLVLLAGVGLSFWLAKDRFGALAIFAGSIALMIYTLLTGFNYGWQKIVQFSGVFVATLVPVMALHALSDLHLGSTLRRWLARSCVLMIVVFMFYTTAKCCLDVHKWSDRKIVSWDWFTLRDLSRGVLRGGPVVVDASSFRLAFFHGMWATYFLPDSHVYFAARGEQNGGYIRDSVAREDSLRDAGSQAVLVARPWADAFDPNSPRIFLGREFALLRHANRVTDMRGVYPLNGVPEFASPRIHFSIRPNTAGRLLLELRPRPDRTFPSFPEASWLVVHHLGAAERCRATVSGPPPWRIELPLVARQAQTVSMDFSSPAESAGEFPFVLSQLRLVAEPVPLSPADGRIDFTASGNWVDYHFAGLFALNQDNATAGLADATLQFTATPAAADVELELVAFPRFASDAEKILPVELWFNEHLVFTSPFIGPGVLRARILREFWNEKPTARIKLRLPKNHGQGPIESPHEPVLVLRYLTTRLATEPGQP